MKISSITALCAMALAGTVQAQTADVNVSGKIKPPACNASFVGGADLDWGTISYNTLSETNTTILDAKPVTLQVKCDDSLKTRIAFWATDPNHDSALVGQKVNNIGNNGNDDGRIFGLGFDPATKKKIGNFTLVGTSASFDGTVNNSRYGHNSSGGHTGNTFDTQVFGWGYHQNETWTVVDANNQPAAGNTLTFSFDVVPQLNKKTELTSSQEVPFSGKAQVYVRYF